LEDYLTSIALGFSFGNLWLCVLLVFSLQTTNRSTCGGYIVGRALAIVVLAVVISLVGYVVHIDKGPLHILSGLFLLGFTIYLAATRLFDWVPPWHREADGGDPDGIPTGCDGQCQSCPTHHHESYSDACSACDDSGLCSAEDPDLEPLTRLARSQRGRPVDATGASGFWSGMVLGSMRGAALCGKLVVLAPVLLSASPAKAMGVGLTFSLASSVYPLLGFALGAFALRLVRYKRALFAVSCVSLAGFSVMYLVKGVMHLAGWAD